MHSLRKRTSAQRSKDEDEGEVLIQDEQEQEEEIAALRQQDIATNALIRRFLDFSILLMIIVSFINLYSNLTSSRYILALITIVQIINLILNLTPDTIPQFKKLPEYHLLALFVFTAIITLCGCTKLVRGQGPWSFVEAASLFSPLVVSVGAWVQKKGEVDTDRSLRELDGARYRMKGA